MVAFPLRAYTEDDAGHQPVATGGDTKMKTLLAAAAAVTLCSLSAQSATLTISIWGGGYGAMWKKHAAEPFEKKTGHKVVIDGGRSSERLSKLIATKGRGTDLIFLTDYQMAIAREKGLLTPVDAARIGSMSQLYGFAKDPLGGGLCPAITVIGAGLAYNKTHFASPPRPVPHGPQGTAGLSQHLAILFSAGSHPDRGTSRRRVERDQPGDSPNSHR